MKGLLLCSKSDSGGGGEIGVRDGRRSFFSWVGRGRGLNLQGGELPSQGGSGPGRVRARAENILRWGAHPWLECYRNFFRTPCRLLFFSMSALLSSLFWDVRSFHGVTVTAIREKKSHRNSCRNQKWTTSLSATVYFGQTYIWVASNPYVSVT